MKTQVYCNVQIYEHPSLLDLCNKKFENKKTASCFMHVSFMHHAREFDG
jgi:hypothetical protein